jgi:hypothetical protein
MRVQLGRSFGWLWSAYAASTYGTRIAMSGKAPKAIHVP